MTTHRTSITRNEQGASLVEMALLLALLLIIFAGVVDFGRVFYTYIAITNASREGARYAARFPANTTNIRSRVNEELAGASISPVPIGDIVISGDTSPGSPIRVTVTYEFSATDPLRPVLLAPFLGGSGNNPIRLSASTEMAVFGIES